MIIFLGVTVALGPCRGTTLFLGDTCGVIQRQTSEGHNLQSSTSSIYDKNINGEAR